jgi:hypothetical protein
MATFTTIAFCLATTGFNPQQHVVRDRVDLIEVNHFYDEKGKLFLEQLIFYDWCPKTSHYNIRTYRLLKDPLEVPRRNYEDRGYVVIWREGPAVRKVYATAVRESWTQYDPEIAERRHLPKDQRKSLQCVVRRAPNSGRFTNGVPRPEYDSTAGTADLGQSDRR